MRRFWPSTAAAAALLIALLTLSRGRGDLSPADFTANGPDALEFCDPAHPRFVPVTTKESVVVLSATPDGAISLHTAAGKPIGPADLERGALRVFAVSRDAMIFAADQAKPASAYGHWHCAVPAGATRVFAAFTPKATGLEMYASGAVASGESGSAAPTEGEGRLIARIVPAQPDARSDVRVELESDAPLAAAELCAFDLGTDGPTGFVDQWSDRLDGGRAGFHLTFNDPGRYVLWLRARSSSRLQTKRLLLVVNP